MKLSHTQIVNYFIWVYGEIVRIICVSLVELYVWVQVARAAVLVFEVWAVAEGQCACENRACFR